MNKRNKHFENAINEFAYGLNIMPFNNYNNYNDFLTAYNNRLAEFDDKFSNFPVTEKAFNLFVLEASKRLADYKYARKALYSLTTKHIPGQWGYTNTLSNSFLYDILNNHISINKKAFKEFVKKHYREDKMGKWLKFKSKYIGSVQLSDDEYSFMEREYLN